MSRLRCHFFGVPGRSGQAGPDRSRVVLFCVVIHGVLSKFVPVIGWPIGWHKHRPRLHHLLKSFWPRITACTHQRVKHTQIVLSAKKLLTHDAARPGRARRSYVHQLPWNQQVTNLSQYSHNLILYLLGCASRRNPRWLPIQSFWVGSTPKLKESSNSP